MLPDPQIKWERRPWEQIANKKRLSNRISL